MVAHYPSGIDPCDRQTVAFLLAADADADAPNVVLYQAELH